MIKTTLSTLLLLLGATKGHAFATQTGEDAKAASAPEAIQEAPPSAQPYIPGLGDLMTANVQPRHIKLWFAGRQHNWPLAAYEFCELKEALADVRRLQPRWNDEDIGELVGTHMDKPLGALEKAIDDKNDAAFIQAYRTLSASCNSCHTETGHAFIVIRVPSSSSFPDQDFRPQMH